MPSPLELLASIYEVSTVVTDVVLNTEYIKREWVEEYALSIAFLVFNGFVMAIVGNQIEASAPNRYARWGWLNKIIAGMIGLLQLRVLVETVYTYAAATKHEKEYNQATMTSATNIQSQNQTPPVSAKQRLHELEHGLAYVTFVQGIVRDVPIFIIQANATIHYRKWEFLDLWAVSSTGITLMNAVAGYVNKKPEKNVNGKKEEGLDSLKYAATLFIFGQFVFRLGAILLVATTTGWTIVLYALAITVLAIVFAVTLHLADRTPTWSAQLSSALLLFPLFTVFTMDASRLTPTHGNPKDALYSPKLWALNGLRTIENAIGVYLGVTRPRYIDFGESTDKEIATIGIVCGIVFVVTLLIFFFTARCAKPSSAEPTEEDTSLYLQNVPPQPFLPPSQHYQPYQPTAQPSAYVHGWQEPPFNPPASHPHPPHRSGNQVVQL